MKDNLDKINDELEASSHKVKQPRPVMENKCVCEECGGSGLTYGWTPSYNDPDNWSCAPEAEPCPACQKHL